MSREEILQKIDELETELSEKKSELEAVQAKISEVGAENADEELAQSEVQLMEDVTAIQMKLIAFKKQLNNIAADEAMESYGDEEV